VFAKLRKENISFVLPVPPICRHVRVENSAITGRNFMKLDILEFSKICRENSSFVKIWQE